MRTKEEAIKWVLSRINQIKHNENDIWRKNVDLLKSYFETTEKTGITISDYGVAYIHYLFPYLAEKQVLIEKLNEDNLSEIASRMNQKPSSVMTRMKNILAFVNWARGRQKQPMLTMRYVSIKRGDPKSTIIEDKLTDEQVNMIINNLRLDEHKLAVLMMAKLGLRISEALGVRFEDFEKTPNGIILTIRYRPGDYGAKGPKGERRIPIALLTKYGLVDDADLRLMGELIVRLRKKNRNNRLINRDKSALQKAVVRAAKNAGVPFHVHAHLFRHHFIAQAAKKRVPDNVLSIITGDRIETIDKYYKWLSPETLLV